MKCGRKVCHKCHFKPLIPDCDWFKPNLVAHLSNPVLLIPKRREVQSLHQPFEDVPAILAEIREYNENLWLCCLLTYGCLLRPHQEIRQLTWGDFSEDMSFISLSGRRNKSGRNRIVPLNPQIAVHLHGGAHTDNIFTGSERPYNSDYFKTLWGKYKRRSKLLQPESNAVLVQTYWSHRDLQAYRVSDGSAASHGACKLGCELGLSQEP